MAMFIEVDGRMVNTDDIIRAKTQPKKKSKAQKEAEKAELERLEAEKANTKNKKA